MKEELWQEVLKQYPDVFTAQPEAVFLAIQIAVQCRDLARSDGLLAFEEFVDRGCGMEKSDVPLWDYLKTLVWLLVDVEALVENKMLNWMLESLYRSKNYQGCQAVQACIYLAGAFLFRQPNRPKGELLAYFREMIPQEAQGAFDDYFAEQGQEGQHDL